MTKFVVRVELIDLPSGAARPEELHKQMEARGFVRSCNWSSLGEMWLPDATYILDTELKSAEVGAKANEAVMAAKQKSRLFVVPTTDGWWASNLLPVEPGQGKG
jgi:hypothetical protein